MMDESQDSKSVIVTKLDDAVGLQLDVTALHDILCAREIADTPLAVIGIAGCLRTGKSFLMTLLMRYLKNNGWQNPQWIGDDDTVAEDGIQWSGGKKAHTEGIVIWNEIFTIQKENRKKIAVLLLDTQGLFDQTMRKADNMKLFAMTILLSSFLMINIKCQIDERELEYLELFVQYAKSTENAGERVLFQDLLFLIRDWQHDDDNAYGLDGGTAYLEEMLSPHPNSELNDVRQNVRGCFRSLGCFLMPHPGLKVTKSAFSGRNGDIDKEFLHQVSSLAKSILDPERINEKSHKGKRMTGRTLWRLLADCNYMFESGSMPSVESMSTAMTKNTNNAACEESLVIYEETMNKECNARPINSANMKEIHSKAWTGAIQHFEQETRFGGEQHRATYRQHLLEKCHHQFTLFTQTNELQKMKAHNLSAQKVHELWTDYKTKMREDIGERFQSDQSLLEMHKNHEANVVMSYQTYAGEHLAYVPEHLDMLKQDTRAAFEKFKKINGEREYLQILGGQGDSCSLEYEGYLLLHELSQQYRDEFEKFTAMYVEEKQLENQNNELRQSYFEIFENTWSNSGPHIDTFREVFMRTLEEECQAATEINKRNKSLFNSMIEEHIMNMRMEYMRAMKEITKDSYVMPEDLEKGHRRITEKLFTKFEKDLAGFEEFREEGLNKGRKELSSSYDQVKRENDSNKEFKPALESKHILEHVEAIAGVVGMVSLQIIRYTSVLNKAKSAHRAVKSLVPTARVVMKSSAASSVLPVVATVGATALAAGVVVTAYCLYKHYKQKKESILN